MKDKLIKKISIKEWQELYNKCEFCEKIKNKEEYQLLPENKRESLCIVFDSNFKDFELWMEYREYDGFYSGPVIDLKYCPRCGRKLNAE